MCATSQWFERGGRDTRAGCARRRVLCVPTTQAACMSHPGALPASLCSWSRLRARTFLRLHAGRSQRAPKHPPTCSVLVAGELAFQAAQLALQRVLVRPGRFSAHNGVREDGRRGPACHRRVKLVVEGRQCVVEVAGRRAMRHLLTSPPTSAGRRRGCPRARHVSETQLVSRSAGEADGSPQR